jgi:rieske iron-sulfur protein
MSEKGQGTGHADGSPAAEPSTRRAFLTVASVLGLEVATAATAGRAWADPASERPKEGDFLVAAAVESESPVPLTPNDIPTEGPQVIAWPFDPAGNLVRKGSRLNKVLLVRLDPAALVGVTGERAADGVVAYSAICPHAGCEVSVWAAEQKILECSCHYSHFDPREGAIVKDGPAPRALPALPLKVVDGKLAVAKPFTSRVGIVPT